MATEEKTESVPQPKPEGKSKINKPLKEVPNFKAILEIKGKQYAVNEGITFKVDRIVQEKNSQFNEVKVLYFKKSEDEIFIGKPFLENVKVKTTIVDEFKDKKVKIVHYKPKSGIRKTAGHRQKYTFLKIDEIKFN